ncbi:MAG: FMN-binding protein [Acidobacteriaceae bacterium]
MSITMGGILLLYAFFKNSGNANPIQNIAPASGNTSSAAAQQLDTTTTYAVSPQTYKDGQYTGPTVDAYYGNVQVRATVQSGKITNVQFLNYPNDRTNSQIINGQATPLLAQEAIQAQNSDVNIVSGATLTSEAFIQSLYGALNQART